jgi:hypothetical protein
MNVNPSSSRFTDVVAWDSLSKAEQESGDWILLPDDLSRESGQARRKTELEKVFDVRQQLRQDVTRAFARYDGVGPAASSNPAAHRSFDALGRVR